MRASLAMSRVHSQLPENGRVDLRYLAVVRKSDKKFIFRCTRDRRSRARSGSFAVATAAAGGGDSDSASNALSPEEAAVNALVHKRSFDEKVKPGKRIMLQSAANGFQLACMADQFNHGYVGVACASLANDPDGLFFVVQTLLLQLNGSVLEVARLVQEGGLQEHLDVTAKLLRPGSGVDFPDLDYRSLSVRQVW